MTQARNAWTTASTSILGGMLFGVLLAAPAAAGMGPSYLGPDEYTSEADAVIEPGTFGFCIENFENGSLDVPGVTGNGGVVGSSGLTDSVDGDDGSIDGSGTAGHSYFYGNGTAGVEFTFDLARTNGLPTFVGIVWTDGGYNAPVTFEAFDAANQSVLVTPYGPFLHADASNYGETAEDRFYGAQNPAGIRRIVVSNPGGGIEVDHLQLNRCVLCGDANFDLRLTAPDALVALKTAVGTDNCKLCVCDANNSAGTSTSDALAILRQSVGIATPMNCPACPEFDPA